MKFYTMESKVVTAKERLGSSLKRYGAIQILLGLGCLIMTFVSIGIDKKVCDNLGKKEHVITNATIPTFSFDKKTIMLGLDGGSVVSAIWIVVTGVIPAYMARNADYSLIKTKVVFMVFSIMAASLFVPIIVGAALTNFILRDSHKELLVITGLISLLEFIVSFAASVYCCASPWAPCKLAKKDKQVKDEQFVDNEKQMTKLELPEYQP
ncbi:uncharacterized protein LOC127704141 [Mytilus californianus]|uniref:uncharacterized protein LOC127704141 n=1 Tax=Mytilus californianus TaxID=6549 RepID=UPI0022483DCC|nr:uncharacterized protein LOC127704141 [Mytilus californianus]